MDLVERYLQAVKFWLSKEQKSDIIAELSEDIHSQMDEQESLLSRKLNEAEVEAILKQRGRPIVVANRYSPQQYLIGPMLFPVYRFALKVMFVCYLIPWVLTSISMLIMPPDRAGFGQNWLAMSGSLLLSGVVSIGLLTMVFAVLERAHSKSRFLEDWNPRKLPPIRNANCISRSSSSTELTLHLALLIWWVTSMSSSVLSSRWGTQISVSPLWPYFFWSFLCVGLVSVGLAAFSLMRPYWTRFRATIRLLNDSVGAALFCWFLKANSLTVLKLGYASGKRAVEFTDAVNLWMSYLLPFAICVAIVIVLCDAFRLVRLSKKKVRPPWQAAVSTSLKSVGRLAH